MEQHFIDALKTDDNVIIKKLYNNNRPIFLGFAKRYNIYEDDSIDIYQEAFLTLKKQAVLGKLQDVNCNIKTYLFGIGKHLIYKKLKEYTLKANYDSTLHKVVDDYDEIEIDSEIELTQEQQLLRFYFKQLGKSCQQMLTLSFYRGLTNDEIVEIEGYESEAVVRSQKSRCLKTLKNLISKNNQ